MKPRPTLEHIWVAYLAAVLGVSLLTPLPQTQSSGVGAHAALHLGLLAVVLVVRWIAVHRSHEAARWWRGALGLGGLPAVFSAMGWLLPGVHPEPFEYEWLQVDRALFGTDFVHVADPWLQPWGVEILQLVYAAFYVTPIAAALGALWRSGRAAFDRALLLLIGGFLASYLCYLLVPTLGPKTVLAHAHDVQGLWLTERLRAGIDAAEANLWDCFPSGHTMLSLMSLIVAWRWNRLCFWGLLPIVLTLIASTMLLRYHWASDVLVGAALAWPCVRLCDLLMDLDAWPGAPPEGRSAPAAT
ncbi:MAG: phosphatase PAP2 family protein [Planctomycetota bacterium]